MSAFKSKMHQIRLWLWLCYRPHWGRLQCPTVGFKWPTSEGKGIARFAPPLRNPKCATRTL